VDITHAEHVEKELNILITRRDAQRRKDEGERAAEALYLQSVRAYNAAHELARLYEWRSFELTMARRAEKNAAKIATKRRARAAELMEEIERRTAQAHALEQAKTGGAGEATLWGVDA